VSVTWIRIDVRQARLNFTQYGNSQASTAPHSRFSVCYRSSVNELSVELDGTENLHGFVENYQSILAVADLVCVLRII